MAAAAACKALLTSPSATRHWRSTQDSGRPRLWSRREQSIGSLNCVRIIATSCHGTGIREMPELGALGIPCAPLALSAASLDICVVTEAFAVKDVVRAGGR
jgi:hypothetical protein